MEEEVDTSVKTAGAEKTGFSNRYMTILVTVSSAVGFGNIWRFPYLVYQHGGLGFIIIYLIILCLIGIPILILESGVGQVARGGQNVAWSRLGRYCRPPVWVAWTSATICCYYPLLLAWSLLFFVSSFRTFGWENPPEWTTECAGYKLETTCLTRPYCQWRNQVGCLVDPLHNTQNFFRNTMNAYTDLEGVDANIGITGLSYKTFLSLIFSWVFSAVCIFAGARIFSYTTYFTMVVPSVLLVVLVGVTATFPGAGTGIVDYIGKFKPNAFSSRSAVDALTQCFFSLSIAQGVISGLSAHGKKDDNFVENSVAVAFTDTFFAIVAGFAVFGMVGFLAFESKLPIEELPLSGISLAFTAYPSAMAQLSGALANFTSVLFFFTLWLVGISTLCTLIEAVVLSIITSRIGIFLRIKRWHATVGFTTFMVLVPSTLTATRAGYALLDALDNFSAMAQVFAGGMQAVCIGWFYLYPYSANKIGRKAIFTHGITFALGACLLGILGENNGVVAIILGVVIPVVGFIVSIFLANKTDDLGQPLTLRKKLFYLTDYNMQPIRTIFNKCIKGQGCLSVPRLWNFCIKYVTPYCCIYLFVSALVSPVKMYSRPSAQHPYPWYIFLISQISPFCMIIFILVTLIYPNLVYPIIPPTTPQEADYIVGEDEMKRSNYATMKASTFDVKA